MSEFLLINGPNLNLLGTREPDVYGSTTLSDIESRCGEVAQALGHNLSCYQSNAEHDLVERVQQAAQDGVDFIIRIPGHSRTRALRCAMRFSRFRFRLSRFT